MNNEQKTKILEYLAILLFGALLGVIGYGFYLTY